MVAVAVAAVALCSLLLVAVNSSLVGDGSYYLLRAIQTGQPFPVPGRQVLNTVREGPLLLGLSSGITNTHVLAVLEGAGFVLLPAIAWVLALVRARCSRMQFLLVAVSCALCFPTMIIFSVSELTLALPLVVLASVLLASSAPWSVADSILVTLASGLLILSHESIAPCAVVLTVQALVRTRERVSVADSRISAVVAALSLAAVVAAVWTLVYRPNGNSGSFLKSVESVQPSSMVLLIVGAALLIGWAAFHHRVSDRAWIGWTLLAPAALFTMIGIRSAISGGPEAAYASRGFCVIIVVIAQLALFVDWIRLRRSSGMDSSALLSKRAATGASVFLLAVMIVPTVSALHWSVVMDQFRSTVTQHTGTVPASDVSSPLATTYLWPWTNPMLSLVVRPASSGAVVANNAPFGSITVKSYDLGISPSYHWGP